MSSKTLLCIVFQENDEIPSGVQSGGHHPKSTEINDAPVAVEDGVEPVRDREDGAVSELLADRVLDELVRLQVDGGRRLVQNQNLRLAQQRPRQTHELPLPHAAERQTNRSNIQRL